MTERTYTDISPEMLRELIDYNPSTGDMTWKRRDTSHFTANGERTATHICNSWNSKNAGKPALSALSHGYRHGEIVGAKVRAHRVAWAIYYGTFPSKYIDHINGDRSDNRISNLREVDRSQNAKNAARPADNTSGNIGVSFDRRYQKWVAYINSSKKRKHLGYYENIEDAISARKLAEKDCGYHENHGR